MTVSLGLCGALGQGWIRVFIHVTEHESAFLEHGLGLGAQTFMGSLRFWVECDSEWLKSLSGTKSGSHKSL